MDTRMRYRFCAAAILFATLSLAADAEDAEVIEIGSNKQLFLDDAIVESSSGVDFSMNPPRRTGHIVLEADAPWEKAADGRIGVYCSLLKYNGKIRLWYDVRFGDTVQVAYAESDDGIHFTKPILGLYDLNGSTDNNIVIPTRVGGGAVWLDPRAPESERYRSQSKGYNPPTSGRLYSYHSPDGIHWTRWAELDIGDCDTQSIAFWDECIGRYVLYTRRNPDPGTPARSRIVRRLDSDDLEHWENEVTVMEADAVDLATYESPTPMPPVDYYGAAVFRYPDERGVYVMLSQPFWHFMRRPPEERWGPEGVEDPSKSERLGPATIDVRLAVSRDGANFERLGGRKPFLSLGPAGAFDSRILWAIPNPVPMGDELWFYYAANNRDHDGYVDPAASESMSGIGLATLRLDGFVSADADYAGGVLTTRPFTFSGKRLEVNLECGGSGSLEVEILDVSGEPIPGYWKSDASRLWGNDVRMPVSWGDRADLGALAGTTVRLRFHMRDCKLYAFQFVE